MESAEIDDPTWGKVKIQRWKQLHFQKSADQEMEVMLTLEKSS